MESNRDSASEAIPRESRATGKRLFVTGASGNLGGFLCRSARKTGWEVVGGFHRNPSDIPGVRWAKSDLSRDRDIAAVLAEIRPAAVIHAAAVADIGACEAEPEETRRINVDASARIAGWCAENRVPMAFASTDMVFGGDRAPYRETHGPAPVCRYGAQKAEAERRVADLWPEAAICRLPLLYGFGRGARPTFDARMASDFRKGRPVRLFRDEFRTPADLESAAAGILEMLGRVRGLVHLGGPERVSRLEMGRVLADLLGADPALLISVRQRDVPGAALRPADLSLDSRRAFDVGYRPRDLREGYGRMLVFPDGADETGR
jgi:dTDP-4-dehydrorhamnose reductase